MNNNIILTVLFSLLILAVPLGAVGIRWIRQDITEDRNLSEVDFDTEPGEYPYDVPEQTELEEEDENPETGEEAVDTPPDEFDTITRMARTDWIAALRMRREFLREEIPRVYDDDWYEQWRKEYSLHAIRHEKEARDFQRRAGIKVRGIAA